MKEEANQKKRKEALRLDAEGKCIHCGKAESGRRRGLCNTDYTRFNKARDRIKAERGDEAVSEFEAQLIVEGLLLPSRQGRRGAYPDPYGERAQEYLATKNQRSPEDAQRLAEELVEDAAEAEKDKRLQRARRTRKKRQ